MSEATAKLLATKCLDSVWERKRDEMGTKCQRKDLRLLAILRIL